jgi:hypothetical protein
VGAGDDVLEYALELLGARAGLALLSAVLDHVTLLLDDEHVVAVLVT